MKLQFIEMQNQVASLQQFVEETLLELARKREAMKSMRSKGVEVVLQDGQVESLRKRVAEARGIIERQRQMIFAVQMGAAQLAAGAGPRHLRSSRVPQGVAVRQSSTPSAETMATTTVTMVAKGRGTTANSIVLRLCQ
jgi:hypothetical protein